MSEGKNEDIWVICPVCKTKLKKENISDHLKYVHDKKLEDFDGSFIKVLPKKENKHKKARSFSIGTIAVILVIVVAIGGAAYFVLSGNSDDSNNNSNADWLDGYIPVHSVGTGSNDFWIEFPSGSTYSGQTINHLSWIADDLKSKPVLFVVHRTGCGPCTPQADRVIALGEKYEEYVKLYDLDITGASKDTEDKYNAVYMYDPNGPPGFIALTGIYTYVKENGEVKIGWHTWEGDVGDSEMESWVKDAIYYYHVNK